MSAPDTRESGVWQSERLLENNVNQTSCNVLENSVTQPCFDIQGRLIQLGHHLSDLRKTLEDKENAARYIHEFYDFNMSEAPPGSENILASIAEDCKATRSKLCLVEREIGNLSVNFDRLSTRVENTEHKLGLTPSNETLPVPVQTFKPRIVDDRRDQQSLQEVQPQPKAQQQGLSSLGNTYASNHYDGASATAPREGPLRPRQVRTRSLPSCTTEAALTAPRCQPRTWMTYPSS